jgi:hypothetical protein
MAEARLRFGFLKLEMFLGEISKESVEVDFIQAPRSMSPSHCSSHRSRVVTYDIKPSRGTIFYPNA